MGLDTGLILRIPNKNNKDRTHSIELNIFYFRKYYNLSRDLHNASMKYAVLDDHLEYNGEYGFTLKVHDYTELVENMIVEMLDIFKRFHSNYLYKINEINFDENEYENDSIWENGIAAKHIHEAIFSTESFLLFLQKRIADETLIDIIGYENSSAAEKIEHLENYDFEHMELRFYYSY